MAHKQPGFQSNSLEKYGHESSRIEEKKARKSCLENKNRLNSKFDHEKNPRKT